MSKDHKAQSSARPRHPASGARAMRSVKLDPRQLLRNPVIFVTEVVAVVVTLLFLRDLVADPAEALVLRPDRGLALVHRAVCHLCRSRRRGARQGAGRQPEADQVRTRRPQAAR